MRFSLIDRITSLEPGVRIEAVKHLTMAEEYLADHFPGYPVMPGVLMLEAMTQSAAWLIRAGEDFAHSVVVLKQARNVKFASFVLPGEALTVTVEVKRQDERETHVSAKGTVDGRPTVSARLVMERFNLSESDPADEVTDKLLKSRIRELFVVLSAPGRTVSTDA